MFGFITLIETNLAISFENLVLIIFLFAGLVFYAKSINIGLMLHLVMYATAFIWFYLEDMLWQNALIVMFMFVVILAFSLYFTSKRSGTGGFI